MLWFYSYPNRLQNQKTGKLFSKIIKIMYQKIEIRNIKMKIPKKNLYNLANWALLKGIMTPINISALLNIINVLNLASENAFSLVIFSLSIR